MKFTSKSRFFFIFKEKLEQILDTIRERQKVLWNRMKELQTLLQDAQVKRIRPESTCNAKYNIDKGLEAVL